ncbi:hypothetical protein llap_20019 [Limosa lapponica baueri]|uniref:Rna-directed dna polymerase from mobile element jockey-like n=1 Tax=Limosa lapponica baueri TaxID=1758121 RepID=A0A2I0T7A0_LIMLA|nr:hypothetical protein llap_20019 [Limosa lapponica baueri]
MDDGTKRPLRTFANDTKLCGNVDTWEGRNTLQEGLDGLEEWAIKNLMEFNMDKMDNKLKRSEQCVAVAKKAKGMLDCIKGITAEIKKSFSHTPGIPCSVLVPTTQKSCGQAGEGPGKGHQDDRRTGKAERLRELGLFSLEKRGLRGDLTTTFLYFKGGYKEDGDSYFT